jgi:hypothetical protein
VALFAAIATAQNVVAGAGFANFTDYPWPVELHVHREFKRRYRPKGSVLTPGEDPAWRNLTASYVSTFDAVGLLA